MKLNIDTLKKKFGKSLITNENLSKYSWFNLGGPADIFLDLRIKIKFWIFFNI